MIKITGLAIIICLGLSSCSKPVPLRTIKDNSDKNSIISKQDTNLNDESTKNESDISSSVVDASDNQSTPSEISINDVTYDMIFHRGGRDLRPENTLYSYLYAIEKGATGIECDMQLTKDNEIVLCHEPLFNPDTTKDENGNYLPKSPRIDLRELTLDEVRTYDVSGINPESVYYNTHGRTQLNPDSAKIPTLDELLGLVKSTESPCHITIDIKNYHDESSNFYAINTMDPALLAKTCYEKVLAYGMEDRVVYQSFDWQVLVELKKLNPSNYTIALWSQYPAFGRSEEYLRPYESEPSPYLAGLDIDDFKGDAVEAAHSLGIDGVSPYFKHISIEMVEKAHNYGMKIIPWTVNTLEDIESIYGLGVDGIITDNGDLLRDFLLSKGEKLLPEREFKNSPYHLGD